MLRYYTIYKPYLVLSQFTSAGDKKCLADYFDLPTDVYPVGRLDYDSEGLLILTNDARLNHRLLNPAHEHRREYWVQVEGHITNDAITLLQNGVTLSIDGKEHCTASASANIFTEAPTVPERHPPIRFRKNIPATWISLTLTEGKNRQVRRMTARVGYPTLRLIRNSIEMVTLAGLQPGQIMEWEERTIYQALFGK